ncbi:EAL domain-containing protein [Colwellia demingiae]|uniref:EAL domain-containing protein n=1 Tax=Colwellia demingiae TaxID=89401 RepID=A0A5C6QMI3_9GAMM|nr:GGDEF domain-containing response regulator [Colwellia demingiae]TWX69820.1 EAL domain-containing protein [Colwellia demingiae]
MVFIQKTINVLIVDDDSVDREMIRRLLSKSTHQYSIMEAGTVDDALILYDQHHFDVILLDYRMPQRDGIEMILEIRTHLRNYGSAIVMLSSATDEELAIACLKAGAQDFISKSEINIGRIQNAIIHAQTRFELEQKLRESYLTSKKLAERDSLTGLANRFVFDESLHIAVANNQRSAFKLGLILFDVDNFKHINDIHGHDVGDAVLIELALRISEALRENELFSRIGGDEFAIMIANLNDIFHLQMIANRILKVVKAPFEMEHATLNVELSIGIAVHPDNSVDSKELIKCSDIALYRAKMKSGSKICFFYPAMQEQLVRRYDIEHMLRSAIENNELNLHYQPVIDVNTQKISGFEALLRINTHSSLNCYPDEFIPIAEKIGVIGEIGEWVIETAISQLATWNKKFKNTFTMAINLSAVQLENDDILTTIKSNIEKHKVNANDLEFEITETAVLNCHERVISRIQSIRDMGCKLALDDFGTGYSSISHLLKLPISIIKFDRTIMPSSKEDIASIKLLEGLILMSNKLELEMVAEGIEEEFQLTLIHQNKVHRAQGYFFSKALSIKDIEKLI